MSLPQIVVLTVPIPFLLLLLIITLYHLTPLLSLLPNIHLSPILHRISNLIPSPKQNLPREFFNLPARPGTPNSQFDDLPVLSVRGKIVLLLCGYATIGLSCGWAYLVKDSRSWLLAIASLSLPSFIATCALFSVIRPAGGLIGIIFKHGGISHSTIFARILPLSTAPVILGIIITAASPTCAGYAVLAILCALTIFTLAVSMASVYSTYFNRPARIRLSTPETSNANVSGENEESWLSEFSQPSSAHISSFAFSPTPSYRTPHRANRRPSNANDDSWLSSPTNTPNSIPPWDLTQQTISTPNVALTRQRSHSPIPPPLPLPINPNPANTPVRRGKSSQATTVGDRTMTTLTSPGGSILAGYEPDPSRPLPRGFAPLTSYPLSPAQLEQLGGSRASLVTRAGRSADALTFIPEQRPSEDPRASMWTLETYRSTHDNPQTPTHSSNDTHTAGRRAPPPPPMPMNLPLPPTPTVSRTDTAVEWDLHAKESRGFLMGERDWVQIDPDVDGLDGWSRESRAVGPLSIIGLITICAFATPLLVSGSNGTTQALYLISLILPAPMIALASYLLRYRPTKTTRQKAKQASIKSSTTPSLALTAQSELPLRVSTSPRLTPKNDKRSRKPNARWQHFLIPKPSVSNFGFRRPKRLSATSTEERAMDEEAEIHYRKNMNRLSGDVWMEMGHAVQRGNRLSRTAEMLKPNPPLCMLNKPDPSTPSETMFKRLRDSALSQMSKRFSNVPASDWQGTLENEMPASPVAISITSPSGFERRNSAVSEVNTREGDDDDGDLDEGLTTLRNAEIQVATKARMSASPIFFRGRPGSAAIVRGQDGFEVDWMTAGVLPNLVSHLRIGSDVRVGAAPSELATRRASQTMPTVEHGDSIGSIRNFNFKGSIDMRTPSRRGHARAASSSVDYTHSPDFHNAMASTPHGNLRQRLRRQRSFSLPPIPPADFADVRTSFEDCGKTPPRVSTKTAVRDTGVDLPPFPVSYVRDLSRVTERDEGNESSLMRETMADMAPAILALSSPARPSPARSSPASRASARSTPARTSNTTQTSSPRPDLGDLAPIIFGGSDLAASFSSSLRSEEELMAEEMEKVLAMDTPTRTEFVISPPPSSYASSLAGRESRSSLRTTRSTMSLDGLPPMPPPIRSASGWTTATGDDMTMSPSVSSALSVNGLSPMPPPIRSTSGWTIATGDTTTPNASSTTDWTTTTADQFNDAVEVVPQSPAADISLDLPELRRDRALTHFASVPTFAHPHPPPIHYTQSISNFSRPAPMTRPVAHPPISRAEFKHRKQQSTETMHSETTTNTSDMSPPRTDPNFLITPQELARLALLRQRKEAVDPNRSQSAMGHREKGLTKSRELKSKSQNQLKPLEIVERMKRGDNRMSVPLPLPSKRVSVIKHAVRERGSVGSLANATVGERSVKISKASTGSGKENRIATRGSKQSTGSIAKPLRA